MKNIQTYNEFVNEGLFKNFVGKALRSMKDFVSVPLNDMMKDISKSGDPKKIIKSLKTYVQMNGKEIDEVLQKVNTRDELKIYLHDTLFGLYTAIKGVQATQKVNNTYFDEMFKNADKNLVKAMSYKEDKASAAINDYVEKTLLPGLEKMSGVKNESLLLEMDANTEEEKVDNEIQKTKEDIGQDDKKEGQGDGQNNSPKISDKLKEVTKKWLTNTLAPILKADLPKMETGKEGDIIPTTDKSQVRRDVVQDMIKNSTIDNIKTFRKTVGQSKGMDKQEWKNRWPVGK